MIRAPLIPPHFSDRRTLAVDTFIDIVGHNWSGNTRLCTPLQQILWFSEKSYISHMIQRRCPATLRIPYQAPTYAIPHANVIRPSPARTVPREHACCLPRSRKPPHARGGSPSLILSRTTHHKPVYRSRVRRTYTSPGVHETHPPRECAPRVVLTHTIHNAYVHRPSRGYVRAREHGPRCVAVYC